MLRALSLPGGSAKGARQIGCMLALADSGWEPDFIAGTSIGGIHAAFLADRLGQGYDFRTALRELDVLWGYHAAKRDLVQPRNRLQLVWDIIRGRWYHVLDSTALHTLIDEHINPINVAMSPLPVVVSAFDVATGVFRYVTEDDPYFMDGVHSTMTLPLIFELWPGERLWGWDGGIVDVAPIDPCVEFGADEIVVLPNHPEKLEYGDARFVPTNLQQLLDRLWMAVSHNNLRNDLDGIERTNRILEIVGTDALPWRHIELSVFWPDRDVELDLETMTAEGYRKARDTGYQDVALTLR